MKTLYQEVYDTLHHSTWKAAMEIYNEVAQQRKIDPEKLALHSFYPILRSLVYDGLAEDRERSLTPEQLSARGNRPAIEYRLTPAGLKKRVTSPQSSECIESIIAQAEG